MPYIKQVQRDRLDPRIDGLVDILRGIAKVKDRPGTTNYSITRIVAGALQPETGWSYHSLSRAIAVFRDAATEMERRLMAKYETEKIAENGDVPEYTDFGV